MSNSFASQQNEDEIMES